MKLTTFLFTTLVGLCVVLGIAFVTPQIPFEEKLSPDGSSIRVVQSNGVPHPRFPTMDQGGPGALRHERTLWIGWVFAALNVVLFSACFCLGIRRNGKVGPMLIPILIGAGLFLLIFTALFFSYQSYMYEDSPRLFLSLPKPTAWMLLALWPFPVFFVVLYYIYFDRWYFTPRDQERLDELVASKHNSPSENP